MLNICVMIAFMLILIVSVVIGMPILNALIIGYVLFFVYAIKKGMMPSKILKVSMAGVLKVKNILIIFCLIGMITGLWRASGTIAMIIVYAVSLVKPSIFLVLAFLLNAAVSFLTGTSFGTSATMGVICMSMAKTMAISPVMAGGAILSGAFFGDRCSPVSSSAHLVCELTGTEIYENVKKMFISALVPLIATCIFYYAAGMGYTQQMDDFNIEALFLSHYQLHIVLIIPAVLILICALLKIDVKKTLVMSIIAAALLTVMLQHHSWGDIFKIIWYGFYPESRELSVMMAGGGIVSMIRVGLVVAISSSYAGIFEETGLLNDIYQYVHLIAEKTTSAVAMIIVSIVTSGMACNQTLATILTCQLCKNEEKEAEKMAISIENTVILIAALIPWSIAGTTPLATIGAPLTAMSAACYLYFVPLWHGIVSFYQKWRNCHEGLEDVHASVH